MATIKSIDLNPRTYFELTDAERSLLHMASRQGSDLTSHDALLNRVEEFIHVRCLDGNPTKLASINRLFTRPAKRLAMTSSNVVMELIEQNRVHVYDVRATVLASRKFLDWRKSEWDADETMTESERSEAHARFLSNAT